jgi:hypothetical protein
MTARGSNAVSYFLHRTSHPGRAADGPACASLADALEASGVPSGYWNAVVSTHPDEIATFHSAPGVVPGGGAQWTIRAPGVAPEFCARERLAEFPGQIPGQQALPGMPSPSPEGPQLPIRADLDVATAATAAAIADPDATVLDVHQAAELEEATFEAYLHHPEAEAELEAGI